MGLSTDNGKGTLKLLFTQWPVVYCKAMIRPPFDKVPDPSAAEALSEMLEPGMCKFMLGESYPVAPGQENTGFPPEPAELLCVSSGAYLRTVLGIQKRFAQLSPDLPTRGQILGLYRDGVHKRQEQVSLLVRTFGEISGLRNERAFQDLALDIAKETGNRLVAAHVIARLASTGNLIDALVIPTAMAEGVHMTLRNHVAPLAAEYATGGPEFESLRSFLRGDADSREPAAIVAATLLPRLAIMKKALPATWSK